MQQLQRCPGALGHFFHQQFFAVRPDTRLNIKHKQHSGKLAMLKNCDVVLTLAAPNVTSDEAPTNPLPFNPDGSANVEGEEAQTPEKAFAATHA